jgi:8-oxo-dGTP diphosphatase
LIDGDDEMTRVSEETSKEHPRPSLTADVAVITFDADHLRVLLIRDATEPLKEQWALPGGFSQPYEAVEDIAARELQAQTGLQGIYMEQLHAFSTAEGDPRGWVVSVSHLGLVHASRMIEARTSNDAIEVRWWPVKIMRGQQPCYLIQDGDEQPGPLAFNHDNILNLAFERLRERADRLGFSMLPDPFTLTELQGVHEAIHGDFIHLRVLRDRLFATGFMRNAIEGRSDAPPGQPLFTGARPGSRFLPSYPPPSTPPPPMSSSDPNATQSPSRRFG